MDKGRLAYFYLAATILLWSATPAVAKLALGELSNIQLLFFTSIVGVITLFLVNMAFGTLSNLFSYRPIDYLKMFAMGAVGIYLYYIFLYGAFAIAPAGQANVINYLWPVFIVVFSIPILNEKYNSKTIIAILLSFTGAAIAFTKGDFSAVSGQYAAGYLLAGLGAICYGLFSVLGKKLGYEKFSSMLVYYACALALIAPTVTFTSAIKVPQSLTTIIAILVLGGVMNSIAFVFWFKALSLGDTHKFANIIYAVPFLAMIWTYTLNSEPVSIFSIAGLLLIVIGMAVQVRNKV